MFEILKLGQGQNINMEDSIIYKPFWKKKEIEILSKQGMLKERKDIDDMNHTFDVYELPDGKILFVIRYGDHSGTMYKSLEEFNRLMKEDDVRKPGENVMGSLLPDGKLFMSEINYYIELLSKKLGIPLGKLDKTLKSVIIIDSVYRRNRPKSKMDFFNKDYLYLVAYLGEVYKKEIGAGEWYFEHDPGARSYIPYIKLPNGKKLDTSVGLFKECYEHYERFYISPIAEVEVAKGKYSLAKNE